MKEKKLAHLLLNWFDMNGRDLPWRHKGGAHPCPYVVFVSELMLQQTTVKTVLEYFPRFLKRFPDVQCLAAASQDEVYQYWQGLGYYSRARSLLASARMIVEEYQGIFPQNEKQVANLKGFGQYTVSSFLALAYNLPYTVVDGNVMRIMCRMYRLTQPLAQLQSQIRRKAEALTSQCRPADYASAIMDLGATVCTPKKPRCTICPWQEHCLSANAPDVEQIPQKTRLIKKSLTGSVYVIYNQKKEVFVRKRVEKGLLSGLYEFPWCEGSGLFVNAQNSGLSVHHVFTHIDMTLQIYLVQSDAVNMTGNFVAVDHLPALSTLMKKVLVLAKQHF